MRASDYFQKHLNKMQMKGRRKLLQPPHWQPQQPFSDFCQHFWEMIYWSSFFLLKKLMARGVRAPKHFLIDGHRKGQ
jgi:hypothetical protein